MVTLAMSELAFITCATSSSLGWFGPSLALLKANSSLADSVYFCITGGGGGTGAGGGGGGGGGVVTTVVSSVRVVVVTGTGAATGGAPKAQVRPTLTYVLAAFFMPSSVSRW